MKNKIFILTILFGFLFTGISFAQEEVFEISFSKKNLVFKEKDRYDIVNLKDCIFTREVGSPQLSYRELHIAVPEGKEALGVEIIEDITEEISGRYNIYPAQKSHALSEEPVFTPPNRKVYSRNKNYPTDIIGTSTQGSLSGVNVVPVRVYPLQYNPVKKTLLLHANIKFRLIYARKASPEVDMNAAKTKIGKRRTQNFLQKTVFNPQKIGEYLPPLL